MKLAILTFHKAFNCGAALQAWALRTILERMGHSVEFPDCNTVGLTERWRFSWCEWPAGFLRKIRSLGYRVLNNACSIPGEDLKRYRFARFRKTHLPERICAPRDFVQHYDAIVIGSDQVWSARHSEKDAPLFFAENIAPSLPKLTYAVSYGDKPLEGEVLERVTASAKRFNALSAREKVVKDQIEPPSGKSIEVVLDPTLLLTAEEYAPLISKFTPPKEPYLFMYTLSTAPFYVETAQRLAKVLGVKAIIAPMYQYSRLFAPKGLTYGISPDRMVGYIANAKYVLAGSFHGTAFATIFKKPFLSLREQPEDLNALSRPGTLLNLTGNLDRIVTPDMSIEEMLQRLQAPIVDNGALDVARAESKAWLEQALSSCATVEG